MLTLPKTLPKFIWHFIKPYKRQFIYILVLMAMAGIYPSYESLLTKYIIDVLVEFKGEKTHLLMQIIFPILLVIGGYEANNFIWGCFEYISIQTHPQIKINIVSAMFAYVEKHSSKFFQENFAGSISTRISDMSKNVITMINLLVDVMFRDLISLIAAMTTLIFVHPLLALIKFIWCLFFIATSIYVSKRINYYSKNLSESNALCYGKIVDSIGNINNVRIFARHDYENKYLQKYLNIAADRNRALEWFILKVHVCQGSSITVMYGFLLFLLVHLYSQDLISIGDFTLVCTLSYYIVTTIWMLTQQLGDFVESYGACNQAMSLITTEHEITDHPDAKQLVYKEGKIEFKNVNFTYKRNIHLFLNKNITIQPGEKIGLVGSSGSGKTSFINLIIRLYDIQSGIISIDDQDIKMVTQDSLRQNIGFIPQDPVLFHRNVIENIRYGKPEATDDEVILAAKKAYAHDFILAMNDGYDSLVGERGVKLSGGQRQRIAIARAILKNAPILILDEATSALDSVTESYIQKSLTSLMQNKTTMVVAHRLSTLLAMDRILVFHKGSIVEDGSHQQLLAINGKYAELWHAQIEGFV